MTKRPYIPFKTRLAATLCHMLRPDENGKLVPVIDFVSAKAMTEDQILSIWNFDHFPIPKHRDGPDVHWNLVPRPIPEHRVKTAKKDIPEAAKDKRVMAAQAEFRRKILVKSGQAAETAPPSQRQKKGRPMMGSKRSGWKRKMDGTAERR